MRRLTVGALLALCSCSGWQALTRSEWVMVWSDETVTTQMVNGTPIEIVKPTPGAKQEIISRDRWEAEIAEGKRRQVSAALDKVPKLLTDIHEPIELMVGEVREVRIEESSGEPEVAAAGSAVRVYWTKQKTLEDFKDGAEVNKKESSLFIRAEDGGNGKVRVTYPGKEPMLVEISVHER